MKQFCRWQNLVTRAEERHKLVTASLNFYKTAEQVCSVLDSLEREYKREDDWLARYRTEGGLEKTTFVNSTEFFFITLYTFIVQHCRFNLFILSYLMRKPSVHNNKD